MAEKINVDEIFSEYIEHIKDEERLLNEPRYYFIDEQSIQRGKDMIRLMKRWNSLEIPEVEKKKHFFYGLEYSSECTTFWFDYIDYNEGDMMKHIQEEIRCIYRHIIEYLEYKTLITPPMIKEYRQHLQKFHLKDMYSGDFFKDFMMIKPDMIIYDCNGDIHRPLTEFAKQEKETCIKLKILPKILYKVPRLKILCFGILPHYITNTLRDRIIL